ncbi:MAG: PAS domain S-box protein [Gracilimonas sp.]
MVEYISIDQKALGSKSTILLSLNRSADRRLIRKNISDDFRVIDSLDKSLSSSGFDLCITDLQSFQSNRKKLTKLKNEALPVYLPIILLVEDTRLLKNHHAIWDLVDDVIEIPVPMKMLEMRVKNQLRSRKHSLQIARQNEKLRILEKAVHSTDVGIIITDATEEDLPIIFANEGFAKLTGYSREEITGKNCRFLQNDDRDQAGLADVRKFIKSGESGRRILRNYKKDGTPFWNELSISPIRNDAGEVTHFIGIQNDISKLIAIQGELQHEKDMHQLVTNNSTDMITRHSLDGTYLYVTPSSEQLLGYTPEELIGKNAFDLIHPEDKKKVGEAHKILHENSAEKDTITTSYRKKTKSGEYKWVETISRGTINSEDNSIVEIQASTRNITSRKNYELELEESVNEKNVLLQEIHHRVKNNLAVISGLLQIQQFDTDNEDVIKILGNSVTRIKSMALIHEKLYRSKSLSHVEFCEYIKDLLHSIQRSQDHSDKIDFHINCAENIILNVNQAVPTALILNELISNAIEHAFTEKEKGSIWINFNEEDGEMHVSVKDNGIGIPQNILESSKKSMGLTIVQTLVKQLSSKLEIKNNNGTEFSFSFIRQDVKGAHSRFV